jgi:hypothetical protein
MNKRIALSGAGQSTSAVTKAFQVHKSAELELLELLALRLEHISVDSPWARRASGLRGNILKVVEESRDSEVSSKRLEFLINRSFEILRAAAQEIPDNESLQAKFEDPDTK